MCGRYAASNDLAEISSEFAIEQVLAGLPEPRYNIAPTLPIAVVLDLKSKRSLDVMSWGLVPHWAESGEINSNLINARIETIVSKPSFRDAVRYRRCVIPASGWFEWQTTLKSVGKKQPYYFQPESGRLLAFAGIYEIWQGHLKTAAIITTDANSSVAPIHDRMPVLLSKENIAHWLDEQNTDSGLAVAQLTDRTEIKLKSFPVTTDLNNVRNQGVHLLQPVSTPATQPTLFG